jgi:hypothetical protein
MAAFFGAKETTIVSEGGGKTNSRVYGLVWIGVLKKSCVQKCVEYSVSLKVFGKAENGVNKAHGSAPFLLGHWSEHVICVDEI